MIKGLDIDAASLSRIDQIIGLEEERFDNLVRVSGLRPERDFIGCDLGGVNFLDSDLSNFNFSGCNLEKANLSNANIDTLLVDDAYVRGATWPPTHDDLDIDDFIYNFTNAKLNNKINYKDNRDILFQFIEITLHGSDFNEDPDSIIYLKSHLNFSPEMLIDMGLAFYPALFERVFSARHYSPIAYSRITSKKRYVKIFNTKPTIANGRSMALTLGEFAFLLKKPIFRNLSVSRARIIDRIDEWIDLELNDAKCDWKLDTNTLRLVPNIK
ncbi:pentapeptide repeat-containing protein [Hyphomonadaceae bacterium ML37]|nr:pentapeptide repeat-containing protein [Hyphomonadaceae bacterium ML37]